MRICAYPASCPIHQQYETIKQLNTSSPLGSLISRLECPTSLERGRYVDILNLYGYCRNLSSVLTDPLGLDPDDKDWIDDGPPVWEPEEGGEDKRERYRVWYSRETGEDGCCYLVVHAIDEESHRTRRAANGIQRQYKKDPEALKKIKDMEDKIDALKAEARKASAESSRLSRIADNWNILGIAEAAHAAEWGIIWAVTIPPVSTVAGVVSGVHALVAAYQFP